MLDRPMSQPQKRGSTIGKLPVLSGLAALLLAAAPAARAQVQESVLLDFPVPDADGEYPGAALLADTTGPAGALRALYGTSADNVFKVVPPAGGDSGWTEKVLWNHTSENAGFELSYGPLLSTTSRITPHTDLFGTTVVGGMTSSACYTIEDHTCGTVFSVMDHKHTKIYSFTGGADGFNPYYGPVADKSGNLYVTASAGGGAAGCGTIVKLTPPMAGKKAWSAATIWSFTGGSDGCSPNALIIDKWGALYGTTSGGGSANCGCGSVFELEPLQTDGTAWAEKTLWDFQGGSDGNGPGGALTAGKGGALYGATYAGGSANQGVVFSVTPRRRNKTGWTEAVIWSFTGNADGGEPVGSLILDKAGVIYGTAYSGGNATGDGTVFKISPPTGGQISWAETTLWQFSGADGSEPYNGLTADKSGVLYGTTNIGGSVNKGTVFSLQNTGFAP